jgi:hypothetical protein
MKILVKEEQYDKLISTITGEPLKGKSFLSGILKRFKNNSDIGRMVLNTIKKGNYEFVVIKSRIGAYDIEFTINDFPFILTKEKTVFHYLYVLSTPLIDKNLVIGNKIGEELFDILTLKHMNNLDYIHMRDYFDM